MAIALPTKPKTKTRTGFPYQSVWLIGSPPKVGKSKMIEGLWQTTKRAGKELKVLHIDTKLLLRKTDFSGKGENTLPNP